jgi:DNA polymerase-3 subunit alpha
MRLTSLAHTRGFYYKPRVDRKTLAGLSGGLIALSACLQGEIPYWLLRGDDAKAKDALDFYRGAFGGDFYLEIQHNGLPDQDTVNPMIVDMARRSGTPLVATNDCHYLRREDARAHEVLLCIQTRTPSMTRPHELRDRPALPQEPPEMAVDFHWIPEALAMTAEIASRVLCGDPQ